MKNRGEKSEGGGGGGGGAGVGGVGIKNTNRLIDTDFEKSKTEKMLNELLARYITITI